MRSMGLPTEFTFAVHPAAMRLTCGKYKRGREVDRQDRRGGYSTAANVGHELRFDIGNFTGRAAYELES